MKTTLTLLQKDFYKFASPSSIREELNTVLFNGVKAVATDSFRLLEVTKFTTTNEAIPDTLITRDSLRLIRTLKSDKTIDVDTVNGHLLATPSSKKQGSYSLDTHVPADGYPRYQTIKGDCEKRSYTEVVISGEYLAEIAEYLARFQKNGFIKLRVPLEKNQAIILEARSKEEKAYAILMPVNERTAQDYNNN